ncbi:hypothetical protein BGZ65_006348 [Modicella reniformis]|uniref:Uncharacterized protein n=1 Tax=Modicella reniformis TaxID=1440133 RepID=A0A9P6IJU0_9FUNG|nr:hypothetical protein BGZ65_006348 [Modicella reniformis]
MMQSKSTGIIESINDSNDNSRLRPQLLVSDDEAPQGNKRSGHSKEKKVLGGAATAVASLSLPKSLVMDHAKPKSASPRMAHTAMFGGGFRSQGGARSLSLTAATNRHLVETTIMGAMSSQDVSSDDGSTASRSDQGQSTETEEPTMAAPEDRTSRNSIYSLYSRAHNMVLHGRDHNSDGDIGSSSHVGVTEMSSFTDSEVVPHLLSLVDPIMSPEDVSPALHPLDFARSVREPANGRIPEPFTQRDASSSLSGSNVGRTSKKHQTVLGASKAAVNGVLGKFRKSVG